MPEDEKQPTDEPISIEPLDNGGVIVRGKGGRFLPGTRPANTVQTSVDARNLARRRQEKASALLRQAIIKETADKLEIAPELAGSAPAAVAAAGGILWRDIVLADPDDPNGPKAYPRDRLDAYIKLGQQAGVLTDGRQQAAEQQAGIRVELDASTAAALLAMLERVRQGSVEATDAETE